MKNLAPPIIAYLYETQITPNWEIILLCTLG